MKAATQTPSGWLTTDFDTFAVFREHNPHFEHLDLAFTASITNHTTLDCFVSEVIFYIRPDGERGEVAQFTLMGRNDYPYLNPALPRQLHAGESIEWLTRTSTIDAILAAAAKNGTPAFTTLWVEVRLSTGERITSDDAAIAALPHR